MCVQCVCEREYCNITQMGPEVGHYVTSYGRVWRKCARKQGIEYGLGVQCGTFYLTKKSVQDKHSLL